MIQIGTEKFLTTEEAAQALGLSVDSVRRYCNDINPKIIGKKIGRDWLISPAEIRKFSKGRRPQGRPKKE